MLKHTDFSLDHNLYKGEKKLKINMSSSILDQSLDMIAVQYRGRCPYIITVQIREVQVYFLLSSVPLMIKLYTAHYFNLIATPPPKNPGSIPV